MNTEIEYSYRTPAGRAEYARVVVSGGPADELLARIRNTLDSDNLFVPEQVDLPPAPGARGDESPAPHEMDALFWRATEETTTDPRSLGSLVRDFEQIGPHGWQHAHPTPSSHGAP